MYLFNGNVVFHVRKQQVSVEHVKLRRGTVIQGFCVENTALVFSLTLDDLSVLEPQGHHAAQKIMLLIFTSLCSGCGLALQTVRWKLQVQASGTLFFPRTILLGLVASMGHNLEDGTSSDSPSVSGG